MCSRSLRSIIFTCAVQLRRSYWCDSYGYAWYGYGYHDYYAPHHYYAGYRDYDYAGRSGWSDGTLSNTKTKGTWNDQGHMERQRRVRV